LATFAHPCKYIYYGLQKQKYVTKRTFLAYRPIIEGINLKEDLLKEATVRFVLKFATYKGDLNLTALKDVRTAE